VRTNPHMRRHAGRSLVSAGAAHSWSAALASRRWSSVHLPGSVPTGAVTVKPPAEPRPPVRRPLRASAPKPSGLPPRLIALAVLAAPAFAYVLLTSS
jgi:hypothetical protein